MNVNGGKLLVVDDCEPVVDYVDAIGSRCGYTIATAYDGVAAVAKAKEFGPDFAVVGIVMLPEMNGFDAATEILRFQPQCKFVFMSGWERWWA